LKVAATVFVATVACAAPLLAQGPPAAAQAPNDAPRILVMPFDNVQRDPRAVWLGEGAAVLVSEDLRAMGAGAITREERQAAFDRLQVPRSASLTDATVIRIGELVGASQIVMGTLELDGDTIVLRARTIDLDTAHVVGTATEEGALTDLFAVAERLTRAIAASPAVTAAAPLRRSYPPVAAFELYIKGLLAEAPVNAANYLSNAIKTAPDFDRARLALWSVFDDLGDHEQALATVEPVAADSTWARQARFAAGLSELGLERYDDAFRTFKALADERPTAAVLNDLGVVQLRRGGNGELGLPTYFFSRAAEADPDDPDYRFNAGYAYWRNHDAKAAIYWLREALRRNAADADAHFVLSAALASSGDKAEAARELELARRLSSDYERFTDLPAGDPVPPGLERVRGDVELPHAERIESTLESIDARDQRELAAGYLERGRRLFDQENDREATAQLSRVIFISPYDAEAHRLLGRIYLRNGRARDAIAELKISIWSHETSDAHIALAQAYLDVKDPDSAKTEAQRALVLDPSSAEARGGGGAASESR
jgi:tetratricopeptide (TPR) repeat protein